MRRTVVLTIAVLAAVVAAPANGAEQIEVAAPAVVQSDDDALMEDLTLTAKGNGWTFDEALAQYRAAEVVGEIAEEVAKRSPEVFVGSRLSDVPGGVPTLYIKGRAARFIRDLVGHAASPIELADNQPFSLEELEARKFVVHRALLELGYREVATGANITGKGVIQASVAVTPGLPATPSRLATVLPPDLATMVELTVVETRLVEPQAAFGGMWMRDDGVNMCTSGWAVRRDTQFTTTHGVATAGHCTGINQIVHPGHATHATTFQSGIENAYGDFEWHTTAESEPDDFYADASTIRDVSAIEAVANISLNEPVCVYGRQTNVRNCSLEVGDVSQACTASGGQTIDRLVQMNGDVTSDGDSGAPWFYTTRAYGIHTGICEGVSTFSVADYLDEALGGVRVKTSP